MFLPVLPEQATPAQQALVGQQGLAVHPMYQQELPELLDTQQESPAAQALEARGGQDLVLE